MSKNNRAALINKTIKLVKKNYTAVAPNKQRSVLEHLLFACCLENTAHDVADQVFESLARDYFDWNEVRVSSIRELAEAFKPLNDPEDSAKRVKRALQSVFESLYSFDMEPLKKQNIGKSIQQLTQYKGTTPFIVAYVTQNGLGGHSIPVNNGLLEAMRIVRVISDGEAEKSTVPGLERVVQKSKGVEIGSLLHPLGVELHRSPYGPTIRKLLLEIDPDCKDRLPKRPSKKKASPPPAKKKAAKQPAPKEKAAVAPTKQGKAAPAKPASKKAAAKTPTKPSKAVTKKQPEKKKVVKKKATEKKPEKKVTKKVVKKKTATKTKSAKTSSTKQLKKRKPR